MVCGLGIVGINFREQRKYRESRGDSEGGEAMFSPLKIHVDVMGGGIRGIGTKIRLESRETSRRRCYYRCCRHDGVTRIDPAFARETESPSADARWAAANRRRRLPFRRASAMDIAGKRWHQRAEAASGGAKPHSAGLSHTQSRKHVDDSE
jgi:hypothetical protein